MIRRARADEVAWVAETIAAAFSVYISRIGRVPMPMTADHAALVSAGEVHVLEDEGKRLGLIVMRREADHLFVDIVAVVPQAQHRGLGRRLMAFAETEALQSGLTAVRLYTNAAMTENLRFYPRLGFRQTDARVDDGFARVFFEKRFA
jgi:ribosomal protein S18 acetylase RimI-like enzyme